MNTRRSILMILILVGCVSMLACATVRKDRKIEFVYLALGASDATGVGAIPLTEGYVFLIKRELEKRVPGVALVNLGVPGARVDLIKEQVRIATQVNTKANLVTLWTGANDLVHGDDPKTFQEDLRFIYRMRVSQSPRPFWSPICRTSPSFRASAATRVRLSQSGASKRSIARSNRRPALPMRRW
jgi:lysophospholipase L1-like esterase